MDSNTPQSAPTIQQAAPAPAPSVNQTVNVVPPPAGEQPKSSKKMIIMLLLGVAIVVLLVGGAYLFVNSKKEAPPSKTTQSSQSDTLEKDINAVDVGNLDSEFVPVDQDLQTL